MTHFPIACSLATAVIVASVGCSSTSGPWEGKTYRTPSARPNARHAVVSPGSPNPFEQKLPSGNAPTNLIGRSGNQ
jgi:hypothetical protein